MEPNWLSTFVRILRESLVIFLKNKCLMASIAIFILLIHSLLFSCYYFSIEPLTKDLVMKRSELIFARPGSSQYINIVTAMTSDFHKIVGLEWFFVLAIFMASLFSSAITILASSVTHAEVSLTVRDLLARVFESCKRAIVTLFYICLFGIGYVFLVFSLIFPFTLNFSVPLFRPTTFVYVLLIPASAFHMYLAVFWNMSLVISVLEEKSGLEAFGEASQVLKGFKSHGFLLNIVYGVPVLILNIGWCMEIVQKGTYKPLMELMVVNVAVLMKMLLDMAFTVLYLNHKLRHEEEVGLQGSLEYTKVSNEPTMTVAEIP
ncbi:hypothetical protein K1719_003477 [Acacia pycnantha]|nr:hypothetical protein K1719_003477 [Acacia pycnantha]